MPYPTIIKTIITLALSAALLAASEIPVPDTATAMANDTAAMAAAVAEAIAEIRADRASAYKPPRSDDARFVPLSANRTSVFRGDGAGIGEALRYRELSSVYVPFTLSSGMNRLLPYGNTAHGWQPLSASAPAILFFPSPRRFQGGDMASASQAHDFMFDRFTDCLLYDPYPDVMTSPELHLLWENGVFEQNTLNLRLSRPLSPNIMVSVFSGYRYFAGTRFNHERNDIVSFYETFRSDTSTIMNHGYNPLADEHALGGSLLFTGADSSRIRAGFTYAGSQNEYALDTLAQAIDRLAWANLAREAYRIDAALLDKKIGPARLNLKAAYVNEDYESRYEPDTTLSHAAWGGSVNSVLFDANIVTPAHVGFRLEGLVSKFEDISGVEDSLSGYNAEIFYDRRLRLPESFPGGVNIRAFLSFLDIDKMFAVDGDSSRIGFRIGYRISAGAAIDYLPDPESPLNRYAKLSRLSVYAKAKDLTSAGAEGLFESKYLGLLLGYQNTKNERPAYAWPMFMPPYDQPTHTFLIAPWTARFGGFSLMSKTFLTSAKPYVKTTAVLSHLIKPRGMTHTFETELGFDYWSDRHPVTFGGLEDYGWDDPIYDLNLKVTAHIKSFRLFYKVDNILNLRQAYVPGYFSPGLTFRWGVNWFLM